MNFKSLLKYLEKTGHFLFSYCLPTVIPRIKNTGSVMESALTYSVYYSNDRN